MVDYCIYRLANRTTCYVKTLSSYIFMLMNKVESQTKAQFFDPGDPIFIIGFLPTFKLPCNTNHIHEEAAMWVLPFIVYNALATKLNSRMSAVTHIAPVFASVKTIEPTTQKKCFRSYPEVVIYLHKKLANDQTTAKMDFKILRYTQPANKTLMEYADICCTKWLKWQTPKTSQHQTTYLSRESTPLYVTACANTGPCIYVQMRPIFSSRHSRY